MVAKIIDGNAVARHVRQQCKEQTDALKSRGITPGLAVIMVGDNPTSKVYVANKVKACTEVGLASTVYAYDAKRVLSCISVDKGVDDFRLYNVGALRWSIRSDPVCDPDLVML